MELGRKLQFQMLLLKVRFFVKKCEGKSALGGWKQNNKADFYNA